MIRSICDDPAFKYLYLILTSVESWILFIIPAIAILFNDWIGP